MPRLIDADHASYILAKISAKEMLTGEKARILAGGYDQSSFAFGYSAGVNDARGAITQTPTIDPESLRPHGRWVKSMVVRTDISALYDYICSECAIISDRESGYCPNCGAKMDEEEEDK